MTAPESPVGAQDVEALERALAAATPGPWEANAPRADGAAYIDTIPAGKGLDDGVEPWVGRTVRARDAALIVAAVNALPALLAEVREARAVETGVRELAAGFRRAAAGFAGAGDEALAEFIDATAARLLAVLDAHEEGTR